MHQNQFSFITEWNDFWSMCVAAGQFKKILSVGQTKAGDTKT